MEHIGCLIVVILFCVTAGVSYLIEGETAYGVLLLLLPLFYIGFIIYKWPHWKRVEALHKMYDYPESISLEFGDQWEREFQSVLSKAIDKTKEPEKKKDLKHCQQVVKKIKDDAGFYYLQRTFRLTGCHISITDSNGKLITTIV